MYLLIIVPEEFAVSRASIHYAVRRLTNKAPEVSKSRDGMK